MILTAVTLALSLCGFFLSEIESRYSAVFSEKVIASEYEDFSLRKAKSLLSLCSVAHFPESLEALMKEESLSSFQYFEREQEGIFGSGIALGVGHTRESSGLYNVTVVLRGTNGDEWYSNFSVGNGTLHAGFESASKFAGECVESYLDSHGISKNCARLTLTGHSRGGAVANLLARDLLLSSDALSVCAYTFAAPNTTTDKRASDISYRSIYNFQNPEDFICYIPLESWGYTKYGINLSFPEDILSENEEDYKNMKQSFYNCAGFPHKGYEGGHKDIECLLQSFSDLCPTTEDFEKKSISSPVGSITLREFMERVSCVLSGENPIGGGLFILSCLEDSQLSPLTALLLEGISFDDISSEEAVTEGAIYSSHICECYEAWLSVLEEDYFLQKINEQLCA